MGFWARQNFSCCGSCAGYELAIRAGKYAEASVGRSWVRPVLGCVTFNKQTGERKRVGRDFHLQFGPLETTAYGRIGMSTEACGRLVCEVLAKHGVPHEWDGSPDTCIKVVQEASRRDDRSIADSGTKSVLDWNHRTNGTIPVPRRRTRIMSTASKSSPLIACLANHHSLRCRSLAGKIADIGDDLAEFDDTPQEVNDALLTAMKAVQVAQKALTAHAEGFRSSRTASVEANRQAREAAKAARQLAKAAAKAVTAPAEAPAVS